MSDFLSENLALVDERHEYSVRWLAEFVETHRGQHPIGLIIRCIDSRLFRVINTDSISRLLGKILEYKVMGNIIRVDDPRDLLVLKYFLEHLDESLKIHKVDRGFIIVEGHSDCGAVRIAHSKPLIEMSSEEMYVLAPLVKLTKRVFSIFINKPNEILDPVEEIVEEAALKAKVQIGKIFYPEIFFDKNVVKVLRKQLSPNRAAMSLHFYIALANAMIQVMELCRYERLFQAIMDKELETIVAFYDIFSAKTYYFSVADYAKIYNIARSVPKDKSILDVLQVDVMELFERIRI